MLIYECQKKLKNKIDEYDVSNFPHTVLLFGEYGCGKHTFANYISNKLITELFDISNSITLDTIDDILTSAERKSYLIDIDELTEKQQNMILKFIEEPLDNIYIILICSNIFNLLDTVKNRCIIFEFEKYTTENLSLFLQQEDDVRTIELCHTPGQLKLYRNCNIDNVINLCNKIVTLIDKASYSNTLSIADKINFDDEYDKIHIDVFMSILIASLLKHIEKTNNNILFKMYNIVNECILKLNRNKRLNKRYILENLLSSLWRVSHE